MLALLGAVLAAGCTVDTETGVGATVQSTEVTFMGTGIDATIALEMTIEFHVGEHVEEGRTFIPLGVDVFVGERIVGRAMFDRPPGFDNMLDPGQTERVTFHGMGFVEAADGKDLACAPGAMVTVLVRWDDMTAGEIGMTSVTLDSVTCL